MEFVQKEFHTTKFMRYSIYDLENIWVYMKKFKPNRLHPQSLLLCVESAENQNFIKPQERCHRTSIAFQIILNVMATLNSLRSLFSDP